MIQRATDLQISSHDEALWASCCAFSGVIYSLGGHQDDKEQHPYVSNERDDTKHEWARAYPAGSSSSQLFQVWSQRVWWFFLVPSVLIGLAAGSLLMWISCYQLWQAFQQGA